MKFPAEYHNSCQNDMNIINSNMDDDKIEITYQNGKQEIIYNSGVKKERWPDGYEVAYFSNNDIKQTFPGDYKTVYFYCESQITQTSYINSGIEIFRHLDKI